MKRLIAVALAAVLLLTGCSRSSQEGKEIDGLSSMTERSIQLTDGRTVTCITWKLGYAGGLSCDWGGA